MCCTITLLLCLFLSLAWAYNNLLVIVVKGDNQYVSAIRGKGQLTNYYYGSQNGSVVTLLQSKKVTWNVYTDNYSKCSLNIPAEYNFLISPSNVAESSICKHVTDSSYLFGNALHQYLPEVSFYFPDEANASSADWLRSSLYPLFASHKYVDSTLTLLVTLGKNNNADMLVVGKDALLPPNVTNSDPEYWWNSLQVYFPGMNWVHPPPNPPIWFDRIFFVILENQPLKAALRERHMRHFAKQGTLLLDFNAIVNPSQPNYVALTAGDVMDVVDDEVYDIDTRNLVDLLEEKGVSWKSYQEDFPGNCWPGQRSEDRKYVRKHNPFMNFNSVRENATRCSKIVRSEELYEDMKNDDLPKYMFYTPNMYNNGHDTTLEYAGEYLSTFLPPLLMNDNFMRRTLVSVLYDEGIKPDNRIFSLLLGDMIPFAHVDRTMYTHYSLLRLVEDQFGLGSLGRNDVDAPIIRPENFYPGSVPYPKSLFTIYVVGFTTGSVAFVLATAAAIFYVRSIRRARLLVGVGQPKQAFILMKTVAEEKVAGNEMRKAISFTIADGELNRSV